MTPQPWTPPAADKQAWTPPVADAQAAKPDQPGYLSQVGTGLWNTVKGLYNVGAEAGGVAADPLNAVEHLKKLKQMVLDPQIDQAIKAGEKWKAGDRSEAVGHALAAVLPGIGPAAANIGEKLGDRDFTGAAADATVLGAAMAAPRVAGAAMDVAPRMAAGVKSGAKVVGTGVRVAAPEVGAAIATAGVGELAGHVVPGAEWATRVAAGQLMRSGVTKGLRAAREAMKPAAASEAAAEALTPGQILAQQSGADWSKLSPSDQAILEHVAKAQAQANAAAQPPRPPMGPPQAPPEAAPVAQAPPPPMAGPVSQVQQPVAPGTGAPQPAGVLQFPSRTPAMGEQMPSPEVQTSQMASEPTAPVVAPAHLSNRTAMAQRFAKGLQDGGITSDMAGRIEVGHLGDSQMQAGMAPRWGNIAEYLGEKVPSELTIPQIIGELKKLEAARPAPAEAPPSAGPISQSQQPVAPGTGAPQPAGVLQFPSRSPEMGNGLPGAVTPAQRAPGGGMGGMKNYFVDPEAPTKAPAPEAPKLQVKVNGKAKLTPTVQDKISALVDEINLKGPTRARQLRLQDLKALRDKQEGVEPTVLDDRTWHDAGDAARQADLKKWLETRPDLQKPVETSSAPSADRHAEIQREIQALEQRTDLQASDKHDMRIDLEAELATHRPAALEKAQQKIDAMKAKDAARPAQAPTPKREVNRMTANPADLAADYKARGMERSRAWGQFVIDRSLRPEINAKEFYAMYDQLARKK